MYTKLCTYSNQKRLVRIYNSPSILVNKKNVNLKDFVLTIPHHLLRANLIGVAAAVLFDALRYLLQRDRFFALKKHFKFRLEIFKQYFGQVLRN